MDQQTVPVARSKKTKAGQMGVPGQGRDTAGSIAGDKADRCGDDRAFSFGIFRGDGRSFGVAGGVYGRGGRTGGKPAVAPVWLPIVPGHARPVGADGPMDGSDQLGG